MPSAASTRLLPRASLASLASRPADPRASRPADLLASLTSAAAAADRPRLFDDKKSTLSKKMQRLSEQKPEATTWPYVNRCTKLQGFCQPGYYCDYQKEVCQPMNFNGRHWRGDDPKWSFNVFRKFQYY